jgi:two-component system, OmpR family, sensor kinase
MSLRVRLALWYGGLTVCVVLVMSIMTYAVHSRAHYDDLDHALLSSAQHIAGKEDIPATTEALTSELSEPFVADVTVQLYSSDGRVLAAVGPAPLIDPEQVLSGAEARPLSPLIRFAPAFRSLDVGDGAYGIAPAPDGSRWRVYALRIDDSPRFLVAASSLEPITKSIARFRTLVIAIIILSTMAAFGAAWLLARRVLRPVSVMTRTAGDIARARQFNQRVPIGDRRDEMGQLAATFNHMLENLEHSYRLQQRFVADASHELRAPLTSIQANLDLLQQQEAMFSSDQREMVNYAHRETHRLSRLVGDLLALARADAGIPIQLQRVELDRVLLDALRDARSLANGQRVAVAHLEPVVVNGDPDRLKQLLLIVLDNALKYTPSGGEVSLGLRRAGKSAEIEIRDTGIGIPAGDLPHVFERFYRADPARSRDPGGTGLGLSIARWIADQHGGSLHLESALGTGTTAIISLPHAR